MKTFNVLMYLVLIAGLAACSAGFTVTSSPSSTPVMKGGIEGFVTIGPVCPGPVQEGDTNCLDQPYQADITIFDSNKNQVERFQTDTKGYFIVTLEPGIYTVHPTSGSPLPIADDQSVTVIEGTFTKISIVYDTGMR